MSGSKRAGICLLCSRNNCFIDTSGDDDDDVIVCEEDNFDGDGVEEFLGDVVIDGAENCSVQLKKERLTKFVLRKILEIPEDWKEEDRGGQSRVQICNDCLSTAVAKAWEIHQQMVALQEEFREVKEEIRETMKERMERMKKQRSKCRNKRVGGGGEGAYRVLYEIAKMAFTPAESKAPSDAVISQTRERQTAAEVIHQDKPKVNYIELDDSDDNFDPMEDGGGDDSDFQPDPNGDDDDSFDPEHISISDSDDEYEPSPSKKQKIRGAAKGKKSPISKTCSRCNSRFRTNDQYESHIKAHEENDAKGEDALNCPQCKFPARTNLELDVHIHNRHVIPNRLERYQCPLCSFKTKIWKHLKTHAESKHPTATDEELGPVINLQCTVCGVRLENLRSYHHHVRYTHPPNPSESNATEDEQGLGLVQCSECGIVFESPDKLHFHIMSTHKRVDKVVCELCGKGFMEKLHLERHKITHERHKRDYICHLCGADYAYQFTLNNHYKKHHPTMSNDNIDSSNNEEVFKCRYCDLTSPFSVVIKRHLQTHKEETGHRCGKCGKYYMNAQGLRRHLIINHPENDETHKCPHCYKQYPSLDSVETHVKRYCAVKKRMDQQQQHTSMSVQEKQELL